MSSERSVKDLSGLYIEILERAMGIEPTSEAWEASILPLYDARSSPQDSDYTQLSDSPYKMTTSLPHFCGFARETVTERVPLRCEHQNGSPENLASYSEIRTDPIFSPRGRSREGF